MATKRGKIRGFKLGEFEFLAHPDATLKEIIDDNSIDLSDGTLAINGTRVKQSDYSKTVVPDNAEIRVSKAAKGGEPNVDSTNQRLTVGGVLLDITIIAVRGS